MQLDVEQGPEEDLGAELNDTRNQIEVASIRGLARYECGLRNSECRI